MLNLLNSVLPGNRIPEKRNLRLNKCEYHEKQTDGAHDDKSGNRKTAAELLIFKKSVFKKINCCGNDVVDADIKPVRRSAENPRICVVNHGNENQTRQHTDEFCVHESVVMPADFSVFKNRVNEKREEQKLHVLPCRFIYCGKGCCQYAPVRPIVKKMKDSACDCREYKAGYLKTCK